MRGSGEDIVPWLPLPSTQAISVSITATSTNSSEGKGGGKERYLNQVTMCSHDGSTSYHGQQQYSDGGTFHQTYKDPNIVVPHTKAPTCSMIVVPSTRSLSDLDGSTFYQVLYPPYDDGTYQYHQVSHLSSTVVPQTQPQQ